MIVQLRPEHEVRFAAFLKRLRDNGDEAFFSPHPFTDAEARRLSRYKGKDYYCVVLDAERVVGYGLLRGWDEGHKVPRLGIAIDPGARRQGIADELMGHLHRYVRQQGIDRVELRVKNDNQNAIKLYEKFGYVLTADKEAGFLIGSAKA